MCLRTNACRRQYVSNARTSAGIIITLALRLQPSKTKGHKKERYIPVSVNFAVKKVPSLLAAKYDLKNSLHGRICHAMLHERWQLP